VYIRAALRCSPEQRAALLRGERVAEFMSQVAKPVPLANADAVELSEVEEVELSEDASITLNLSDTDLVAIAKAVGVSRILDAAVVAETQKTR
jgi:hypothetical protein